MRPKTSIINRISLEEFRKVILEHNSYSDILRYFNLVPKGGNNSTLKQRIVREGLNVSHFDNSKRYHRPSKKRMETSEVLKLNSSYSRYSLKRRLLKEGLLENKCYKCGTDPIWNGELLTLQLHHKNGAHNDHRLENLQLLCPNCHSQTPNFAGKNTLTPKNIVEKTQYASQCSGCEKLLGKRNASGRCSACANKCRS